MINQSTIDKLIEMRLTSMADAFRIQMDDPCLLYTSGLAAPPQHNIQVRYPHGSQQPFEMNSFSPLLN